MVSIPNVLCCAGRRNKKKNAGQKKASTTIPSKKSHANIEMKDVKQPADVKDKDDKPIAKDAAVSKDVEVSNSPESTPEATNVQNPLVGAQEAKDTTESKPVSKDVVSSNEVSKDSTTPVAPPKKELNNVPTPKELAVLSEKLPKEENAVSSEKEEPVTTEKKVSEKKIDLTANTKDKAVGSEKTVDSKATPEVDQKAASKAISTEATEKTIGTPKKDSETVVEPKQTVQKKTVVAKDAVKKDASSEKLVFPKVVSRNVSINLDSKSAAAPVGQTPTNKSIYQSRSNFGVNFGSLFVQEKWIYDRFFINNTNYELDAIRAYIGQYGTDKTKSDLEDHWNNYCSDSDWSWLQSKGVTAVRIPVGYWTVGGGQFTSSTDFAAISSVYVNAWNILIEKYIKKAAQYNIGVLVDLHAVPKGANTDGSSGEQFSTPNFWNDTASQTIACNALNYMAGQLSSYDNVTGIQVVNESVFDNNATAQKSYYKNAISTIRSSNGTVPIIISDGWWTDQWVQWIRENGGPGLGVVIDNHVYRCYSDSDKMLTL
ncbi:unnamed protein product [Ambrosiozyma monospora]|uniref:Unnamed protein product n=1 Tax=Ambrosiozyma monospora TaxID=43982 RepID=A0ACB5T475_AMBMO|nr:unnamed protein product [Ambrosiozyma monospora]